MGFLTSIIQEVNTKKGTLGQIGFITPSPALFYTIVGAATAATFTGLAVTFYNATTGKMTARCAQATCASCWFGSALVLPHDPTSLPVKHDCMRLESCTAVHQCIGLGSSFACTASVFHVKPKGERSMSLLQRC